MSLICDKISDYFPIKSRQLGQTIDPAAYEIVHHDDMQVRAFVESEETVLQYDSGQLTAACSCSWFERCEQGCKHLWAAILFADANELLPISRPTSLTDVDFDSGILTDDDLDEPLDRWDEDDGFISDFRRPTPAVRVAKPKSKKAKAKPAAMPAWQRVVNELQRERSPDTYYERRDTIWPSQRQVVYILDLAKSQQHNSLCIDLAIREPKRNGEMSKPKRGGITRAQLAQLPDPRDRQILAALTGANGAGYSSYYYGLATSYQLGSAQIELLLPMLAQTERFFCRHSSEESADLQPIQFDDGPPWSLHLVVTPQDNRHFLTGELRRGDDAISVTTPQFVGPGFFFGNNRIARLDESCQRGWLSQLRKQPRIEIPASDHDRFLAALFQTTELPPLHLPPKLEFETVAPVPRPCLKLTPEKNPYGYQQNTTKLEGELAFDYDGLRVLYHEKNYGIFQAKERRLVRRDAQAEKLALEKLLQLGFREQAYYRAPKPTYQLAASSLPKVLKPLLDAGWLVEAEGKIYRQASSFQMNVESGIDWFELHGGMQFGDQQAALPDILKAIKGGQNLIQLGDGTFGMLPESWLEKYGLLAGVGQAQEDHLRFGKAQVGLLDALLASMPDASVDVAFAKARDELRRFDGIAPVQPPAEFQGQLRPYQCEGLGWLQFLQRFGFGGCLADDMGLGKTVQLLALLADRRRVHKAQEHRASLIVVPKSLIFNWKQEAARFAPALRVLDHTGLTRDKSTESFHDFDLILTTYGILRRDALLFKDVDFDVCALDEAQAVKNAQSESAKAVRLLRARHRLALSGTPIENHLGELWSLFEFLNPGMLGHASIFKMTAGAGRTVEPEVRGLLAKALRPFILRRTKEQVAKDLPRKTEQTLYCDLEPGQRKIYNELRDYYRQSLLGKIAKDGLKKSKIQVLEALLRLRQAACHPGLIDAKYAAEESAKLDLLLPQLKDVFEEGHKVLVFSQFTSLLALVKKRLDAEKLPYEYLDGKTRDRAGKVEHFQNDPDCKLFLISLKAGGLGLNLTAAEYVYLLDPWWNPAVEAQAIDRAHRIGQDKPVFAYRVIARDTVEEKVLELQKSKRELADAILNADNRLIADLSREDLEMLLT